MKSKYKISESAFSIIESSEGIEGFLINNNTIKTTNQPTTPTFSGEINKELVFDFLNCPDTKVYAVKQDDRYLLFAHNSSSNETIQIEGLGDHFFALAKAVHRAKDYLNGSPKITKPITHQFVESINAQLLSVRFRYEEVGIGKYRDIDFLGKPVEVCISSMKNGKLILETPFYTEPGGDGRVRRAMDNLLNWVNNDAFKDEDNTYTDLAKFHAEFIRIHPFRDGNGRTARILTNYLLLINRLPMVNIPAEKREQYISYINYAEAISEEAFRKKNDKYNVLFSLLEKKYGKRDEQTRFLPLAEFLKENSIPSSKTLIEEIIDYKGIDSKTLKSTQVQIDPNIAFKE